MALIICYLDLKTLTGESRPVIHKERGIVQNGAENISLKPADFSICVTQSLQNFGSQI